MEILFLILAMVAVGLLVSGVARFIWRGWGSLGREGTFAVAVVSALVVGLMDWYVISAMGFSDTLKYLGVAIEPAMGALLVLWIIRRAKPSGEQEGK